MANEFFTIIKTGLEEAIAYERERGGYKMIYDDVLSAQKMADDTAARLGVEPPSPAKSEPFVHSDTSSSTWAVAPILCNAGLPDKDVHDIVATLRLLAAPDQSGSSRLTIAAYDMALDFDLDALLQAVEKMRGAVNSVSFLRSE